MSVESVMPSAISVLCDPLVLLTHLGIYPFPRTLRDYVSDGTCSSGSAQSAFGQISLSPVLASHLLCNQSVAQELQFPLL